ncbi:malto-oligosyltrehalose synthase [Patulibacter minatonensis]|uniref:malto-oligosyltrehalose synthase n=1 Tax=Patulibacter minatonensis TaxID=298163 RepID=UPI0004AFBCD5|nr:malto-oligosyltrehalose synthase [Patulibacter minatonensis]
MSVPRATYRIQLTPDQDFAAVRELVPYLRDLGISHLYLSPSLTARSGSTHGYDVVDPTTVSAALGGEDGLRALADAGLGIVLDIVPNHMGVGDENRWWSDPEERVRVFDYDPEDGWYRRFFDIDDLAGVRVEDPDVFALTHDKVLELVRDGVVDGLRIDHPDGLADPAQYLRRLQDAGVAHVWVEKILSAQHPVEELPDWPVEGTVGYEFLGDATALFVDPAGEEILTDLFAELTGETRRFDEVALETQRVQATTTFSREVERLRTLHDVLGIADALAGIPVYRTYARPASGDGDDPLPSGPSSLSAADRDAIAASDAPEELQRVLRLEEPGHGDFVTKFQQTSPPVTAKGVEDTAFYRYVRLLALNEVGHEPDRFSLSVDAFHARNTARLEHTPHGLLSTQTHDTKRSGDVRARIGALAGMAGEWADAVHRWRALTADLRTGDAPDGVEELTILQTLVGAWPLTADRLSGFLQKAMREAKVHTTWAAPDEAHESAVIGFATALLEHRPFLDGFVPFAARVAARGRRSALAQTLLKLTVPGVPDVYQGDELETLSLVDPDNRRPVDWERRRGLLASVVADAAAAWPGTTEAADATTVGQATDAGADPDPFSDASTVAFDRRKLAIVHGALALRGRLPDTFATGAYRPVEAGPGVVAFTRGDDVLVVVVVRANAATDDGGAAVLQLGPEHSGTWESAIGGPDLSADGPTTVASLVDEHGLALLRRRRDDR